MNSNNLLSKIREEKKSFRGGSITVAGKFQFSQYQTLQRIELYDNSEFETGEFDDDGYRKYFLNIVSDKCENATKEVDLDTKDIIIRAQDGNYVAAEIMAADLRQWMRDNGMAAKLNEIADDAPKYGSVVVKTVKGEMHVLDIKNLYVINQAARSLKDTPTVEIHEYSYDKFRDVASRAGWDNVAVQKTIETYEKLKKPTIHVDERYGLIEEKDIKKDGSDKLVYALVIVAGCEEQEIAADKKTVVESGQVLFAETFDIKDNPYKEWHWKRVKGRWLGRGVIESLFAPQIRVNEVCYYMMRSMLWVKRVFQTDDQNINSNSLLDLDDGDIIKTSQGKTIQSVDFQERNLPTYNTELTVWNENAKRLSFVQDIVTGESLPSGTPATLGVISDRNIRKHFDRKREDFGIFLRDIIVDNIIPRFIAEKGKDHVFSITGTPSERERIEQLVMDVRMSAIFQKYLDRGQMPTLAEWQRIELTEREKLSKRPSIDLQVPDAFYKNVQYKIDVVITKENEDTEAKMSGAEKLVTIIASNPEILQNPTTRPYVMELAHLLGVKVPLPPPRPAQPAPGEEEKPMVPGARIAAPNPAVAKPAAMMTV